MTLICQWQKESPEEDGKLYCRAYPEHPECKYKIGEVKVERICGKLDYYLDQCSHFIAAPGIERLLV